MLSTCFIFKRSPENISFYKKNYAGLDKMNYLRVGKQAIAIQQANNRFLIFQVCDLLTMSHICIVLILKQQDF